VRKSVSVGRLTVKLIKPPGALVPAFMPLVPFSSSIWSLLSSAMLVSALMGRERMMAAYAHAIAHEYRFYSYGDSSLLLP
jgi:hypothetical protein